MAPARIQGVGLVGQSSARRRGGAQAPAWHALCLTYGGAVERIRQHFRPERSKKGARDGLPADVVAGGSPGGHHPALAARGWPLRRPTYWDPGRDIVAPAAEKGVASWLLNPVASSPG